MRPVLPALLVLAACAEPAPVDLVGAPGAVRGVVRSWDGFVGVSGATVEIEQWPRSWGAEGAVVGERGGRWVATTEADGSFSVDPWTGAGFDPAAAVPPGRARVRVTAPGHELAVFYVDLGFPETCEAAFADGAVVSCQHLELDLLPEGDAPIDLLPDVTVEPSTLADCRIETLGNGERRVRVSVGTPNVGRGPVELRSVPGSQAVRQVLHRRGGATRELILQDAAFVWDDHEDHNHFHFEDWTWIRVLDLDGTERSRGTKLSFCLIDLEPYDDEIYEDVWGGGGSYGCGVVDGEILQGLSPGRMDVYSRHLAGQHVDVSGLPAGDYWLDVEVDPQGFVVERDETNNAARVLLRLPEGPVAPDHNPCQPAWAQPGGAAGPVDPVEIDISGRDELIPGDTCAAAPERGAGAYWGTLAGLADDIAYGSGEDGVVAVRVGGGATLTVDANLSPGDAMLQLDDDCAADGALASVDVGWAGQAERLVWTNPGEERLVYVILDNYEASGAGRFALDLDLD